MTDEFDMPDEKMKRASKKIFEKNLEESIALCLEEMETAIDEYNSFLKYKEEYLAKEKTHHLEYLTERLDDGRMIMRYNVKGKKTNGKSK